MSNRKKKTYEYVFRWAHENLGITGGLQCAIYMADYEPALTDAFLAVTAVNSQVQPSHCHFHFSQACERNKVKCPEMLAFMEK